MTEHRHAVAERLEQQDVLGRVADVVLAADDVADAHRRIVDDDREVVERRPVAAHDDEVPAEVGRIDLDPVADQVVPRDDALADAEAEGALAALGLALRALVRREVGTPAHVARRQLRGLLGLAVGVELLGRAVARVREVLREQPGGRLRVALEALHLSVWRVRPDVLRPRDARSLVPGDAQPVQPVEDVALERLGAPGDVGVLEPEEERAPLVASMQEVEQRGPRGPDVQRPRGAGRDPDAQRRVRGGHPPMLAPRAAGRSGGLRPPLGRPGSRIAARHGGAADRPEHLGDAIEPPPRLEVPNVADRVGWVGRRVRAVVQAAHLGGGVLLGAARGAECEIGEVERRHRWLPGTTWSSGTVR